MYALNFEIASATDSLGAARSGAYLLFTFLGGATSSSARSSVPC